MTVIARTAVEIAVELIAKAIVVGDCWECHLEPVAKGYCYVAVGGREGRRLRVHRLVYAEAKGAIPDGLMVLHTCDNRRCIRPEHLFLGTAQNNTDDMITKGRKIDDSNVGARRREATGKLIGSLLAQGLAPYEILKRLGISYGTYNNYVNGPYRDSLTFPAGN